ncbi:MAG: hypothetical protein ACLFPL_03595 [Candidatus Nanoarchaeia archaeon]
MIVMRTSRIYKKGAGDAISTLILFIAVLGISIGLIVAFQQFSNQTQSSLKTKQDSISDRLDTQLSIIYTAYDTNSNITTTYLKNIGNSELDTQSLSFFVGGEYIANPTITNADTGASIRVLGIQDTIKVELEQDLNQGVNKIIVASEFGNTFVKKFNVE